MKLTESIMANIEKSLKENELPAIIGQRQNEIRLKLESISGNIADIFERYGASYEGVSVEPYDVYDEAYWNEFLVFLSCNNEPDGDNYWDLVDSLKSTLSSSFPEYEINDDDEGGICFKFSDSRVDDYETKIESCNESDEEDEDEDEYHEPTEQIPMQELVDEANYQLGDHYGYSMDEQSVTEDEAKLFIDLDLYREENGDPDVEDMDFGIGESIDSAVERLEYEYICNVRYATEITDNEIKITITREKE